MVPPCPSSPERLPLDSRSSSVCPWVVGKGDGRGLVVERRAEERFQPSPPEKRFSITASAGCSSGWAHQEAVRAWR